MRVALTRPRRPKPVCGLLGLLDTLGPVRATPETHTMSVFDWLFRRNRTPASEPLPPPLASPTPPSVSVNPAPVAAAAPVTDPYGTEFLPVTRAEIVAAAQGGNLLST